MTTLTPFRRKQSTPFKRVTRTLPALPGKHRARRTALPRSRAAAAAQAKLIAARVRLGGNRLRSRVAAHRRGHDPATKD